MLALPLHQPNTIHDPLVLIAQSVGVLIGRTAHV